MTPSLLFLSTLLVDVNSPFGKYIPFNTRTQSEFGSFNTWSTILFRNAKLDVSSPGTQVPLSFAVGSNSYFLKWIFLPVFVYHHQKSSINALISEHQVEFESAHNVGWNGLDHRFDKHFLPRLV